MPDYMPPFRARNRVSDLPWYFWLIPLAYVVALILIIPVSADQFSAAVFEPIYANETITFYGPTGTCQAVGQTNYWTPGGDWYYIGKTVGGTFKTRGDAGYSEIYYGNNVTNQSYTVLPTDVGSFSLIYTHAVCAPSGAQWAYKVYNVTAGQRVNSPVAGFSCVPTSQFPNADVVCTDTSTNTPTTWHWMVGINGQDESTWSSASSQNYTWQKAYPALYTVKLYANNTAGGSWYNRTDYVSISNNATPNNCNLPVASGYVRSQAQCVDTQTSGAISGCNLQLNDLEGGAWSNVSNRFDGTWCIDTLPGHHINAFGDATGYTSASRTNLPASGTVLYELLMIPGYVPPAASGKVWLYIIVNDYDTGQALPGALVQVMASGETTKSDVTSQSGQYSLQWKNSTQTTITASKTGWGTVSKTITTSASGPDTVRIELHRGSVTPTATATTGPGGTIPTTLAPGQNADGTYVEGYSSMQGQEMMNWLAANGMTLVQLCFMVTMFALLGVKFGK